MKIQQALTFDDVLLLPSHSNVMPSQVITRTFVTRRIAMNIPVLSAAMDTVTEAPMAIAMAQNGGIGVIHRNNSPEQQCAEVRRVKRFESGIVYNPITLHPQQTLGDAQQLQKQYKITGFPVVEKDTTQGGNGRIVGIITERDMRFVVDKTTPVSALMTANNLAILTEPVDLQQAKSLMRDRRIEKILVVDNDQQLKGLLTSKDIKQAVLNPQACKDDLGRLRVAAATTTGDRGFERTEALLDAEVDLLVLDTAHGHAQAVLDSVERIKKTYSQSQVIAGNVATAEGTRALIDAGADAVKVGIGPGSICTTRVVAGVGVPQLTAVMNSAAAAANSQTTVIADGGIKFSGDLAKAIAAGAGTVMLGSLLAGTDEAPGDTIIYQGRSFKAYRGMGSLRAMQSKLSADRYGQDHNEIGKMIPEGIEGQVAHKGTVGDVLHQLVGGLKAAMGYTGHADIDSMRAGCSFVQITGAGLKESHVHGVRITRESPNYRGI